jgi:hypothetical protein
MRAGSNPPKPLLLPTVQSRRCPNVGSMLEKLVLLYDQWFSERGRSR